MGYKARNYHKMLKFLLQGLIAVHKNPSLLNNKTLHIGNKCKKVHLRLPVAYIVADTQGADKLCGRYNVYTESVSRIHRACDCPPELASDTTNQCNFVTKEEMMAVIEEGDKDVLAQYSQHEIPDHAFRDVDFGQNHCGIYGATPNDTLHGIQLGIAPYMLKILHEELNPKACKQLDQIMMDLKPHLRQSGKKHFPRLFYPDGITKITKLTADETIGLLFITVFILNTPIGKKAILNNSQMPYERVKLYIKTLEKLLAFHSWLKKKSGFWLIDDNETDGKKIAVSKIKSLMKDICRNFERDTDQGWNLSKVHELLHIPHFIEMFGAPSNFDSGPCERMHKDFAKKPGRRAQKQHKKFTFQAAKRVADSHVIEKAHSTMQHEELILYDADERKTYGQRTHLYFHLFCGANRVSQLEWSTQDGHPDDQVFITPTLQSRNVVTQELYPDLVDFLKSPYVRGAYRNDLQFPMHFCTEYYHRETCSVYRAHYNFRGEGPWHDWAWISYKDETNLPDGFTNVPAKILGFIYVDSVYEYETTKVWVICHPCEWEYTKVSRLVRKWTLAGTHRHRWHIPYDIVKAKSLDGLCLIVPNLDPDDGSVYEIMDPDKWPEQFSLKAKI